MNVAPMERLEPQMPATTNSGRLKEEIVERLAAHRLRRSRAGTDHHGPGGEERREEAGPAKTRVKHIAASVADRYAKTLSYEAFLAAEAMNAIRHAEAVAEVAARTAQAVAAAQQAYLDELNLTEYTTEAVTVPAGEAERIGETESDLFAGTPNAAVVRRESKEPARPTDDVFQAAETRTPVPVSEHSTAGLTVRLYEDVGLHAEETTGRALSCGTRDRDAAGSYDEVRTLDEEIAYRQSSTCELDQPSTPIAGNLLEFPRQLVAARRARPRYAEGPLREDGEPGGDAQLRIFEVEATLMSSEPAQESAATEWSSIWLDALAADAPEQASEEETRSATVHEVQTATLEYRLMAGVVDGCMIGMGFLAFAALFAYTAAQLPPLPVACVAFAGTLLAMYLGYQLLFFTFAEATPGMRYARVGLCTFSNENPTRTAMRYRIWAVLLAAFPLGIGLVWAWLDDERLGWHDRISRMYLRSY